MFTPLQAVLFGIASVVTFFSYQMIPRALEIVRERRTDGRLASLVTSPVFTLFIRFCGVDHLIMAAVMISPVFGSIVGPGFAWVAVASAVLVAVVSAMSAWIVRRETG